jgi:hypothetical protein
MNHVVLVTAIGVLLVIAGASRLRKAAPKRTECTNDPRIGLIAGGFLIEPPLDGDPGVSIRWNDIHTIHAFKRDLLTTDLICLLIGHGNGAIVELHEQMPGWKTFAESLEQHLPGIEPFANWYLVIVAPAFEPNGRQIYSADAPP